MANIICYFQKQGRKLEERESVPGKKYLLLYKVRSIFMLELRVGTHAAHLFTKSHCFKKGAIMKHYSLPFI